MADSHSTALQEAYLLHRFEQDAGRKPTSKMELLEWLASTLVTVEGPDFETWAAERQQVNAARLG